MLAPLLVLSTLVAGDEHCCCQVAVMLIGFIRCSPKLSVERPSETAHSIASGPGRSIPRSGTRIYGSSVFDSKGSGFNYTRSETLTCRQYGFAQGLCRTIIGDSAYKP